MQFSRRLAEPAYRVITKSRLAFACLSLVVSAGCGTTPSTIDSASPVTPLEFLPALRGDYFKFASKAVGRAFHIYVSLPDSYAQNPNTYYPVVYALDGDSTFPVLATQHRFLILDEGIPEAIIVGIAYGSFDPAINKRAFDFSAPAADAGPSQGGAPAFHTFLKTELIPEIERRHRADPAHRALIGQSRGGYMTLYSAFVDPDLFWGRIAINPAFDPGRERFSHPAPAAREDLSLIVTSGSRDLPKLREKAIQWFAEWERRSDAPWQLHTATIEGGTHAADFPNSYRIGMISLFKRVQMLNPSLEVH